MKLKKLPTMLLSLVLLAATEPRPLTVSSLLDLRLEAPEECPSTTEVVAAVEALVRTISAQPLQVTAKIQREGRGYALRAMFGAGEREVQGDSCTAVSQALIAITALAIDPSVRLSVATFPQTPRANEAASTRVDVPSERPSPLVPAAAPESATPRASELNDKEFEFGASLLGLGEWGALPEASYGVSALLRASLRPWSVELGGSWLRRRWVPVDQVTESKGGYVSWLSLQGNGCRSLGRSLGACGGFELGQMTGEGRGVSKEDIGHSLWLAATLTALGRLPVGRGFSLEARAAAAFPLFRPEFSLEPYGPLHQAAWVSGRLSVGIGFR